VKVLLILALSILSVSAFAKDWSQLQRAAENRFLTQNEIPYYTNKSTLKNYEFYYPINQVEVSDIDDPRFFAESTAADFGQTLGLGSADWDYVEIHLHSDSQVINCYAKFKNGVFESLDHCKKREGNYGSWVDLESY
jgi:hypothetical protein